MGSSKKEKSLRYADISSSYDILIRPAAPPQDLFGNGANNEIIHEMISYSPLARDPVTLYFPSGQSNLPACKRYPQKKTRFLGNLEGPASPPFGPRCMLCRTRTPRGPFCPRLFYEIQYLLILFIKLHRRAPPPKA